MDFNYALRQQYQLQFGCQMNNGLAAVLAILRAVEEDRIEGFRRCCKILLVDLNSPVAKLLMPTGNKLLREPSATLLKDIFQIVQNHQVMRNTADWPFENFWGNPYEPRHSKLLGFFIDPKQEHGCGEFMLGKLLTVLENSLQKTGCFPCENCEVISEKDYIDLRIEQKCKSPKYAIIIENKVNRAKSREDQLADYVERVRKTSQFDYSEIHVFYLPITGDINPHPSDLEWLKQNKIPYKKITFQVDIRAWLQSVLKEWPPQLNETMRDHVRYYSYLVEFLVNKGKEQEMNQKILKRLAEAQNKNQLPSWSDVQNFKTSAEELADNFQLLLRGTFLLKLRDLLKQQGETVWLRLEKDGQGKIPDGVTATDQVFEKNACVCIRVSPAVAVCCGSGNEGTGFWIGYMRDGETEKQNEVEEIVHAESNKHLRKSLPAPEYYAFSFMEDITYDNCLHKCNEVADKLMEMHDSLLRELNAVGEIQNQPQ